TASTGTLTFTVLSPLSITTASLPPGAVGTSYQTRLAATGGIGSLNWTITGLPSGLSSNAQTGDIFGTAPSASSFPIGVRVTDSQSNSAIVTLTLTISAPPAPTITTPSLPNGTVGIPYSASISASGNGSYTFALSSGSLPDGLFIFPNG